MFINRVDTRDDSQMSVELTLALLTLDTIASFGTYCKFRSRNHENKSTNFDYFIPIEELEENIIKFKHDNNIETCSDAIKEYLVHNSIITKAELVSYDKAYIDVLLYTDLDNLKLAYSKTQEFSAIIASHCIKFWKFSPQGRKTLNNFTGSEARKLAKYVVDISGTTYAGSDFDTAAQWALLICNNVLVHKKADVFRIIEPRSTQLKGSGENDNFDIADTLTLESINLDSVKDFQRTANLIYELNKRLYFSSNSGMFYSAVRLKKDLKKMEIKDILKKKFINLGLSELTRAYNNANSNSSKFTRLPNNKLGSDSFIKVLNNREQFIKKYEAFYPLDLDKMTHCFDEVLAYQKEVFMNTGNKNNDLVMPVPGAPLTNKGASASQIHAAVYMGLNALNKFEEDIASIGLTILDVPDKIFYDKSYIRRFKTFEDYMTCYDIVDELVAGDKHEILTLPSGSGTIIDNENLIPSYEKRFLNSDEYIGVNLIPLKDILNKSKTYSPIEEAKNFKANDKADFKVDVTGDLSAVDIESYIKELRVFHTYIVNFQATNLVKNLFDLPGLYSEKAYNPETGFYDIAPLINEKGEEYCKIAVQKCLLDFMDLFKVFSVGRWGVRFEKVVNPKTNRTEIVPTKQFEKFYNTLKDQVFKIINLATEGRNGDKIAYILLRFIFIATYFDNMLCEFGADLLREGGGVFTEGTSKEVIMNTNNIANKVDYLSLLKLTKKHKELFEYFTRQTSSGIETITLDLDINQMFKSSLFTKLNGCSWPVPLNGDADGFGKTTGVEHLMKLIKSLMPPSFSGKIIPYYINTVGKFVENNISKGDIFAPHSAMLEVIGKYLYPVSNPRKLPKGVEIINDYYTYNNQAVIVERKGNRGYVHYTGNVVFPVRDDRIAEESEVFTLEHRIVSPKSLEILDRYSL